MATATTPAWTVVASLPQTCAVCGGAGRTAVTYPDVPGVTLTAGCAHCTFGLPVRYYPTETR